MRELDDITVYAMRFAHRTRMEYREYRRGKKYLKLLDKLKIGQNISYDVSCWDDERYGALLNYLDYIAFRRVKRIENIDNDTYFCNQGVYFTYNRKMFKFVRVWGQGSYSYVERLEDNFKNYWLTKTIMI